MRWFSITISFLVLTTIYAKAQVSQGGRPLDVPALKSRGIPEVVMPPVNNLELEREAAPQNSQAGLKPFRFAHGFDVNLSPSRHGIWLTGPQGFQIWKMKIRSKGAYSLNVIFSHFNLPPDARLFLFNEDLTHTLGAFTSVNNKPSGKFAVSPVEGEALILQYEIPPGTERKEDFVITSVNHDFMGLFTKSERRPMKREAGACNIDVRCEESPEWSEVKNAVCRMIVNGKEVCTGTLLNNTSENQDPWILSAAHCYDRPQYAEVSVYTFNYESPYCAPLDGDPSQSVSGAVLKASSDSLDFALTRLTLVPPPEYRPYFAGWNHSGTLPDSTVSIHHPQGDIKKIAYDDDPPVYSDFPDGYEPNGFLKILRWDGGVTEAGSSGGGLFNPQQQLIGTLTGGSASCSNPKNDYYARFDMAWEYKPDSTQQLKYWLDPLASGVGQLDGAQFYTGEDRCQAFTNLTASDQHENVVLLNGDEFAGYWGGSNSMGITEFTGRFSVKGNEKLAGISMGIGKLERAQSLSESEITVNVYNGNANPEIKIHSQPVKLKNLVSDAMNYIPFNEVVEPADTFFVGFELTQLHPRDSLVLYQSLRASEEENFFWFKQNETWYNFKDANTGNSSMANVFELVACNVNELVNDTPHVKNPMEGLIYPNPASGIFTFEAGQRLVPEKIEVYNMLGQRVTAQLLNHQHKKIEIDLSGNLPGIYFVRFRTTEGIISGKISWVPR